MKANFFNLTILLIILILSEKTSSTKKTLNKKNSKNQKNSEFDKSISTFLINNDENQSSIVNFKIKKTPLNFLLGIESNKFIINNNQNFNNLEINGDKEVTLRATQLSLNSLNLKGDFKFNEIPQWKLFMHDSFTKNNTSLGWDYDKTTNCKYFNMLGGYCQTSNIEISKEITNLPEHKEIKVQAAFHFLGNWDSHTGYLQLDGLNYRRDNPQIVWTDRCISTNGKNTIEMCDFKTCKMNDPVNISVFHKGEYVKLIFGSTLKQSSCEQSYAVSDVKVYIR